jgi:hypothetical protein
MRDELGDEQARDFLARQQEHRVALFFAEHRDEHVRGGDFAAATGLHLEDRALQHPLEAQRGLHFALVLALLQARRGFVHMLQQLLGEAPRIGTAGLEDLTHPRGIEDGQQQVLHRQEFVAGLARLRKGTVKAGFKFS